MADWRSVVARALGWFALLAAWVAAFAPAAWWVAIMVHAVRARRFLGRWPFYGNPDPKDLPLWLQREQTEAAVAVAFLVFAVTFGLALLRRRRPAARAAVSVAVLVLAWAVVFGLVWWDPGELVSWYFD